MARPAEYREWDPEPPLQRHVVCTWAGRLADDGTPYTDRVLPDGCVDIVWDGERLFVAGPDTGPQPLVGRPGAFFVGLRFRPGSAPSFLGVAASELVDLRVGAPDVLGSRARPIAERLHAAASLRTAALELESEIIGWLPGAASADPLVDATVRFLGSSPAAMPVGSLARELGVSERQLHRRCTVAVGYGPKMLHRVLRFRQFLELADQQSNLGLARLAVEAGYADQAHLTRETRRLAGVPPTALIVSGDGGGGRPIRARQAPQVSQDASHD